jgi:hypothetical protein
VIALRYMIADELSRTARALKIVAKNRAGNVVKIFRPSAKATATWYRIKWIPTARGTFRYFVGAKDLASNTQSIIGSAKVVVR